MSSSSRWSAPVRGCPREHLHRTGGSVDRPTSRPRVGPHDFAPGSFGNGHRSVGLGVLIMDGPFTPLPSDRGVTTSVAQTGLNVTSAGPPYAGELADEPGLGSPLLRTSLDTGAYVRMGTELVLASNPLLPSSYDLVWSLTLFLMVVVVPVALALVVYGVVRLAVRHELTRRDRQTSDAGVSTNDLEASASSPGNQRGKPPRPRRS